MPRASAPLPAQHVAWPEIHEPGGIEGRLATEAAIKAVRTGAKAGGVNPVADLPAEGVVTKDNADQFTGEWPG